MDWHEVPISDHIHFFSANGVPWPLDEWLRLTGRPTTDDISEVIRRWHNNAPTVKKDIQETT